MYKSKILNPKSKINHKSQIPNMLWILLLGVFMGSCSTVHETARSIWGTGTKELYDSRKEAVKQTFKFNQESCYNKTLEILGEIKAYIYAKEKDKSLIAVYISDTDTTPVGIFFKKIDNQNTQVEVSSPSTFGKEYIATKLFSKLITELNPVSESKEKKLNEVK